MLQAEALLGLIAELYDSGLQKNHRISELSALYQGAEQQIADLTRENDESNTTTEDLPQEEDSTEETS